MYPAMDNEAMNQAESNRFLRFFGAKFKMAPTHRAIRNALATMLNCRVYEALIDPSVHDPTTDI